MSKGNKKRPSNPFLPTMEDFNDDLLGDLGDDASLEAELMELMGSDNLPQKTNKKNTKKNMKPIQIDSNLLNMDINEDNNDDEFDENDPELLAELNSFLNESEPEQEHHQKYVAAIVKPAAETLDKLEHLKSLYQTAVKQAQATNDSSKSSRYSRSLKKIDELVDKARRGQPVDESEFPPTVYVSPTVNVQPISPKQINKIDENPPKFNVVNENLQKINQKPNITDKGPEKIINSNVKSDTIDKNQGKFINSEAKPTQKVLDALIGRQNEYKTAALQAKSTNNLELARGLLIVIKQFDEVITSVKSGQTVFDLDDLPPPPSEFKLSDLDETVEEPSAPVPSVASAVNIGEELQIRLHFYKDSAARAGSEGNDNKARRLARVIAQYEEAQGAYRRRDLKYPFQELPPPPGRQPLVVANQTPPQTQPSNQNRLPAQSTNQNRPQAQSTNQTKNARSKLLLQRQVEFKAAALKAKQSGDLALAKDLLKKSMGFEKMIQAAEAGLPIDLSQLPSLPTEQDFNFEMVCADQCETPQDLLEQSGTPKEILQRLATVLSNQCRTCQQYANSVGKSGDIVSQKRFQALAESVAKDLDSIRARIATCTGPESVPKFHYEYRAFSVTQSNPDLAETEMQVEVVRATDLGLPAGYSEDQFDTYVVLELGFPSESPQSFTTAAVRKSASPQYGASTKFQVNLKSRVFQRFARSKQLRADIFYRRGFLQKDRLYGSAALKLDRLDTGCTLHAALDILEGRRVVAGKLELRVRVRCPLSPGHQTETVREKWLVIDDTGTGTGTGGGGGASRGPGGGPVPVPATQAEGGGPTSIDVARFEVAELKRRLGALNPASALATVVESIRKIVADKEGAIQTLEARVRAGGKAEYLQSISALPALYNEETKKFLHEGKRDKAQISMTKKKIVEKEIELLKKR